MLYVGASRADITPPIGTCLYGYTPDWHSTSLHDPLQVTAIVFSEGEEAVLLFSVTAGDMQTELCDELRARFSALSGIPASRIWIAATHTHSAPNTGGAEGWGDIDREYVDGILIPGMETACREALASPVPVELAIGETESLVGVNRRQIMPDGRIEFGQNPWGAIDRTMTCIAIRHAETKAGVLNIIHYGCHGTAAGQNREITRDWSGVMLDRLESETGVLSVFLNAAVGDIGPRLTNGQTTGDIRHVEELGGIAAADALRAYRACGGYHAASMRLFSGEVRIPYKPMPPLSLVEEKLASYADPASLVNIDKLIYAYWRDTKRELLQGGVRPTEMRFSQLLVSIGDILFIPFFYEIFSEIALRLRAYAPYRHVLCLSSTNGYRAYLPSEDQICRGGYEVESFRYCGPYALCDNADQHMISENLRILREGAAE